MIKNVGSIGNTSYSGGNLTADQIRAEIAFRDYTPEQKINAIHKDMVELSNKLDAIGAQNNSIHDFFTKFFNFLDSHVKYSTQSQKRLTNVA